MSKKRTPDHTISTIIISTGSNTAIDLAEKFCNGSSKNLLSHDFQGEGYQRVDGKEVKTRVYAKQIHKEKFRSEKYNYLDEANVVMMVCDMSNKSSFNALKDMSKIVDGNTNNNPSVVVVGIMPDGNTTQKIAIADLESFSNENGLDFIDGTKASTHNVFEKGIKGALENTGILHQLSSGEHKDIKKMVNLMKKASGAKTKLGGKLAEAKVDSMIRKIDDSKILKAYQSELKDQIKDSKSNNKTMAALGKLTSKLRHHESEILSKAEKSSRHELT